MTRFDRDTAVTDLRDGCYEARIAPGWWIINGPNGGYITAILVRALQLAVGDPARHARSLTVHFMSAPAEGPIHIETSIERRGRSLTSVSARLEQQGRSIALALAAFSRSRDAFVLSAARWPEAAPPEACELLSRPERSFPFRDRFELRHALGGLAWSGAPEAWTGGWIRPEEPHVLDAPLVAALTDAWPPSIFSQMQNPLTNGGVPTVDLTIHFRAELPPADARPEDFALVSFRTRTVRDGFLEEDGEVWSRGGTLVAQSRQLAILL